MSLMIGMVFQSSTEGDLSTTRRYWHQHLHQHPNAKQMEKSIRSSVLILLELKAPKLRYCLYAMLRRPQSKQFSEWTRINAKEVKSPQDLYE